jgi:Predicted integral membrane protein
MLLRATILAFAIRITLVISAWLIFLLIIGRENEHFPTIMLEAFKRWDAGHYEAIAQNGYATHGDYQERIVFFPLYPYLVRYVEYLIPSFLVAGLFVSAVASVAAGYFIQAIVRFDGQDDAEASRSLWYFFVFPTAYFLAEPYTEALFMALILGSFYMARRGQWYWAAILGAFATASRLEGMVLLPALVVEALHQKRWRGIDPKALSLVLVPLGFLFYLYLNYYLHGDFFAFVHYEDINWFHHRIWPWDSLREAWAWLKAPPGFNRTSIYELRLASVAIVAALLLIGIRWLRPSYQIFGWLGLAMFLSASFELSVPRYVLTLFPIYFVLARLGRNPEVHQALLTVSALLMGLFFVIYTKSWGF